MQALRRSDAEWGEQMGNVVVQREYMYTVPRSCRGPRVGRIVLEGETKVDSFAVCREPFLASIPRSGDSVGRYGKQVGKGLIEG